MRTVATIDYSEAKRAVDLIVEKALQMREAVAVGVADSHGDLICFARMDGAPVSSIHIAQNKAWTAARERKPTKEIGEKVKHSEKGHDIAYYGDPRYVGWGGGIPDPEERRSGGRGRGQRLIVGGRHRLGFARRGIDCRFIASVRFSTAQIIENSKPLPSYFGS